MHFWRSFFLQNYLQLLKFNSNCVKDQNKFLKIYKYNNNTLKFMDIKNKEVYKY